MTTLEIVTLDGTTGIPQTALLAARPTHRLTNNEVGALGEELAARYLIANGYRILARNWRDPGQTRGELDLICQSQQNLVVIEVKTRRNEAYGPPGLAVDARKLLQLRRLTGAYLRNLGQYPAEIRFDVIAILLGKINELSRSHRGRVTAEVQSFEHFKAVA